MRHRKAGAKLADSPGHKKALSRNLAIALLTEERIRTTQLRGKESARVAERMITLGRKAQRALREGDEARGLHLRRQIVSALGDARVAAKVVDELGPRFADRPGGYTRILKLGPRHGDAASMVQVELVE